MQKRKYDWRKDITYNVSNLGNTIRNVNTLIKKEFQGHEICLMDQFLSLLIDHAKVGGVSKEETMEWLKVYLIDEESPLVMNQAMMRKDMDKYLDVVKCMEFTSLFDTIGVYDLAIVNIDAKKIHKKWKDSKLLMFIVKHLDRVLMDK